MTDTRHTKARIRLVDGSRIREELKQGKVVIVAGFQGITSGNDITTLGRGWFGHHRGGGGSGAAGTSVRDLYGCGRCL